MCYDVTVNLRLAAALAAGKLVHGGLRRLGIGGGTAAPGLVAGAIDPRILGRLTASLAHGSIIITGTNGKTTTSRMISDVLRLAGYTPIHNRSGSNMIRGLTSTVVARARWDGTLPGDIGVWEVDEATLPEAILAIRPRLVLISNLFRDQLDRYGEVNTVAAIWEKAIAGLPDSSILVLNADDPRVAYLGSRDDHKVLYYGLDDDRCALPALPEAVDSIHCLRCARPMMYEAVFSSHMGRYRCTHCGLERPAPDVKAVSVQLTEAGSEIVVLAPSGRLALAPALPGLYNAYNALAATAVTLSLLVSPGVIEQGIAAFKAAFGRVERLRVGDKSIELLLVKNPTGFNEVLRTVFAHQGKRHVLILINDLLADGTDVSWLWDVDFEAMRGKVARATVGGIRAHDMALRLRYADVQPADGDLATVPDAGRAISAALDATPVGETLYILPTYTAMLAVKTELARGGLAPRWQDD